MCPITLKIIKKNTGESQCVLCQLHGERVVLTLQVPVRAGDCPCTQAQTVDGGAECTRRHTHIHTWVYIKNSSFNKTGSLCEDNL